ncbi:ankyrin repeat domain-containing protein [Wolbachia pipientis]|uniref:ankyrin repeat domain-containing protein n=1 Tax=Wolbachia TaxID=953 RepID=UPI0005127B2E|nr:MULTISPECIES: ankyrin repeat domain-containing protein [Wolbachia]MBA8765937.1 ankyrin repeat domain-containing protein [Wolbachia pipientis]QWE34756.1 Ankyrin repeat domain protein [Wolbachia endosymbiont of Drosophila simulans]CDR79424.1 ankyrin repeat domain protein,Ribulose-5-phosphate 4-epimerase and related epimerases and aldolases,transient-receptor-potential calcium channel protein,Ankyrin repeats (3 copies) [Wolbachia endosymbiont of Drosophila simulans wAu]
MSIKEQEIDAIFQEIEQESKESDIIEEIKQKLLACNQDTYNQWKRLNFHIDHLFEIRQEITHASRYYTTALNIAAHKGLVKTVRRLLEKGAEVSTRDGGGYTALHCAASSGNTEIIELLLEQGAHIHSCSKLGSTPLHFAATNNHINAVRCLLNKGASPLALDNNNSIPSMFATDKEVIAVLEKAEEEKHKENAAALKKAEEEKHKREMECKKKRQAKMIAVGGIATALIVAGIGYIVELPILVTIGISVSIALVSVCIAYVMSKPNTKMEGTESSVQEIGQSI